MRLRLLQWEQNNLSVSPFCMRLSMSSRVYIKWRVPSQIDILYWFISRESDLSEECEIVRLRLLQWEQNYLNLKQYDLYKRVTSHRSVRL